MNSKEDGLALKETMAQLTSTDSLQYVVMGQPPTNKFVGL